MYTGAFLGQITPLVGIRDVEEHARRRRPWNRAFNWASVKEFEPVITNRVQQLVEALDARKGQVIDLAEWIGFFTFVLIALRRVI